jgi:hypothetical protein
MEEIFKAIVNLINTGGALADDALYLYFALQFISAWSWSGPLMMLFWLGYKVIMAQIGTPSDRMMSFMEAGKPIKVYREGYYDYWSPSTELMKRSGFVRVKEPSNG